MTPRGQFYTIVACFICAFGVALAQGPPDPQEYAERARSFTENLESRGLAQAFTGVTRDGRVIPDLFRIESTGVSTEPVRVAADAFLASLDEEQRDRVLFPVDDSEWRRWGNQHINVRQGVGFEEMSGAQREAAFGLMEAALSARGLKTSRDIMRLNHTLGELNGDNFVEYGEWKYWITIMGEPSANEPWGWQLDGHHLILNYFVLGDQVVMSPVFLGSEPVIATSGKYDGVSILQEEQSMGLTMIRGLTDSQRTEAILESTKDSNNSLAQAFEDNLVLDYAGVRASSFSDPQREQLLELIGLWVHNMKQGHAEARMSEIVEHLDETYFAWIGGTEDDSVYYYRIQSPVILIEFDHQQPVGLTHLYPPGIPFREHIHTVMRTPNGNDYGKDILRQHYEEHPH